MARYSHPTAHRRLIPGENREVTARSGYQSHETSFDGYHALQLQQHEFLERQSPFSERDGISFTPSNLQRQQIAADEAYARQLQEDLFEENEVIQPEDGPGSGQVGVLQRSRISNAEYAQNLQQESSVRREVNELVEDIHQEGIFDERELQIARDASLAFYMDSHDGQLPDDSSSSGSDTADDDDNDGESFHPRAMPGGGPRGRVAAESSSMAPARGERQAQELVQCVSCTDDTPRTDIFTAPCGDLYCRECLAEIFQRSMTDETLFPPRCCTRPFPLDQARPFLAADLVIDFEAKSIELSTGDRTYCHDPQCSTFIPPTMIENDIGTCPQPTCYRLTCSMCKAAAHIGDCPNDAALHQLTETAQREGWRRCDRCRRFVELTVGCNHMTCLCGHQFCFVCGRRWGGGFGCPPFNQTRLMQQAANVVDRGFAAEDPRAAPADDRAPAGRPATIIQTFARFLNNQAPPARLQRPIPVQQRRPVRAQPAQRSREARIARVAQQMRANHDCTHPSRWTRYQQGYHQCEQCLKYKKDIQVAQCRHCYFVSCYPCRRLMRNRER